MLHDESLSLRNGFVSKTDACCKASAGYSVTAVHNDQIAVDPKDIMRRAVDLYIKHYTDLIAQGYPAEIARTVAKQYVTGK